MVTPNNAQLCNETWPNTPVNQSARSKRTQGRKASGSNDKLANSSQRMSRDQHASVKVQAADKPVTSAANLRSAKTPDNQERAAKKFTKGRGNFSQMVDAE
jgi:hypothetical protein